MHSARIRLSLNIASVAEFRMVLPVLLFTFAFVFPREYERDYYVNDRWIPIGECSDVSVTQCDITEDISGTLPYNLRVRAVLGSKVSQWTTLSEFFNRVTSKCIRLHSPLLLYLEF